MANQNLMSGIPTASEFIEFAKRTNAVNLDVSAATLLESADGILRGRPGYVLFNIRCGLLIIDRSALEIDAVRAAGAQEG